ncbi:hypothetical protein MILUP08_45790 [Micromonospora lupini str. Lupac 08]|uniref:Uncharacterized protein n=1 Tax=Micromonospora lupini str. Lupac 08 TaxID=1150864 RepID=I0LAP9_9ACTN|nr:hypothetical protein MILUP08_45790 [Micromonospora lupini str. Lupac 08]
MRRSAVAIAVANRRVDVLLSGIPQRYEYDSEVYRSRPCPPHGGDRRSPPAARCAHRPSQG